MLQSLKGTLELLKELLQLLIELYEIVKRHRRTVAVISGLALVASAIYWYSTYYPGLTIYRYLRAISEQQCAVAWEELHENYREARWQSYGTFCQTYSTSAAHENVSVRPRQRSFNPFRSDAVTFTVSYEVIDRFTQQNLGNQGQDLNRLWLEIAHRNDYQRLVDGSLGSTAGANPSLSMRRRFKRLVTVRRSQSDGFIPLWKITKFQALEDTLIRAD